MYLFPGLNLAFDPTYVLVIIGLVITLIAQVKLKSTYAKYSKVESMSRLTGADVARRILSANGVYGVTVNPISGSLTDHYDPGAKTVNLSEDVYGRTDIAALGVAAHECGHALQDFNGYAPLKFRNFMVPVANIGAKFSWVFIIVGLILAKQTGVVFEIGLILFSLSVFLQLITLPVEFNASNRALAQLEALGIVTGEEKAGSKKVLSAAAMTYVAAAATALLQLLRLILIFNRNRD